MNLKIGSYISWSSAAGHLTGKITNIVLSPSASGAITPWIDVAISGRNSTRLCANDGYLAMMKVEDITDIMVGV
jgi:hypothetical protein